MPGIDLPGKKRGPIPVATDQSYRGRNVFAIGHPFSSSNLDKKLSDIPSPSPLPGRPPLRRRHARPARATRTNHSTAAAAAVRAPASGCH